MSTITVTIPDNHTDELFDLINEALLKTTPKQLTTVIRFIGRGKAPSLNKPWRLSIVTKLKTVEVSEKRDILLKVLDALIIAGKKIESQ